jgi:Putative zincin peptidase
MSTEHKRDYSISMLRANLIALSLGLPVAMAQLSLFVFLNGALRVPITLAGALLFFAVMLVSIVAHELIHGLTWQLASRSAAARVTYGVQWKLLTPYAHLEGPIALGAYRLGGLMPGLVLGLIPYALSLALDNSSLLLFSVIHTFAAGGDWLVLWLLRGVRSGALVEDHPSRAGCYVLEPERASG